MAKLWGGRFSGQIDAQVNRFNASISFDKRLYGEDIDGSIAWAGALASAGILTTDENKILRAGLEIVRREFDEGSFVFAEGDEDIHTAVERRLTELVGDVGGKLHTGRSRNDQVATDFRLWCMRATDKLLDNVRELQDILVKSAEQNQRVLMPGYTHLQHAQPVTWAHWILSHFWPLARDAQRLKLSRDSASTLPLGSAALAGTAYDVDREELARELGFVRVSENSLDAVSDRDFAVDFLFAMAMLGVHLSRLAEQLILFNSREFSFITLSDAFSTGSSLMPQKKNPDTLELARGKSGRLIANLTGLLVTLKGLPSSYDKDLQEDKEPVFSSFDTLMLTLPVLAGTISTLELQPERMRAQLESGLLATDLADYLVHKGLPFRQAHEAVGEVIRVAENRDEDLDRLPLATLHEISSHFTADVLDWFNVERSVAARRVRGGTAPEALTEQLAAARSALSTY